HRRARCSSPLLPYTTLFRSLLSPAKRGGPKGKVAWYDYILAVLSVIVAGYWPVYYDTIVQQLGGVTEAQLIIGSLAILLVLEASDRKSTRLNSSHVSISYAL